MNNIRKFVALAAFLVAFSFVGTADYLRLVETPSETNVVVMRGNPERGTDIAIPARKAASARTGTLRQQGAKVQYPTNIPGMGSLEKLLQYLATVSKDFSINCFQSNDNGEDIFVLRAGVTHRFTTYAEFVETLHQTMHTMGREVSTYDIFDPNRPIRFFWTLTQYEEFPDGNYFLAASLFGRTEILAEFKNGQYSLPNEAVAASVVQVTRGLGWHFQVPVLDAKLIVRDLETGDITRYKNTQIDAAESYTFTRNGDWYLEKQYSTNGSSQDISILIQLTFEDGHKATYDANGNEVLASLTLKPVSSGVLVQIEGAVHEEIYEVGQSHNGFSHWNWVEVTNPTSSLTFPITTNNLQFFRLKQK